VSASAILATAPPPEAADLAKGNDTLSALIEGHAAGAEAIGQMAEARKTGDDVKDAIENPYEEPEVAEHREPEAAEAPVDEAADVSSDDVDSDAGSGLM
jgi:hypothetical protein